MYGVHRPHRRNADEAHGSWEEAPPLDGAALPNVEKPATVLDLGAVDVQALRARVERLSEKAWSLDDARKENDFDCFDHTRHVIFRFIHGNRSPLRCYVQPGWMVFEPLLSPVMAQAAAYYGYAEPSYPKAMLARLAAGRGIGEHIDAEPSNPLVHKIHVPLVTNPRAVLTVAGAEFHLPAGRAFEVNNLVPHGAFNGGERDRIHFIFEVFEGAGAPGTHWDAEESVPV